MIKKWIVICSILLCGCVNEPRNVAKVFSNAQVQYQAQEPEAQSRKKNTEMASYFFNLDYKPQQESLNKHQKNKIDLALKKLIYPEEYKLYVTLGAGDGQKMAQLTSVLKRAQNIRKQYAGKVKSIEIAYIKQQKPDSAYFRLIS